MEVEYEKQGRIAIITLNRPEARNAINGAVARRMEEILDDYESDPELWVAILTANGSAFCAGADLKEVAAGRGGELGTRKGGFAGLVRRQRTKPLIAAIAGSALAGGTEIALACDMIVCASETNFGLPEVKRSLVAAAGGLFRLPRAIGMADLFRSSLPGHMSCRRILVSTCTGGASRLTFLRNSAMPKKPSARATSSMPSASCGMPKA